VIRSAISALKAHPIHLWVEGAWEASVVNSGNWAEEVGVNAFPSCGDPHWQSADRRHFRHDPKWSESSVSGRTSRRWKTALMASRASGHPRPG